MQMSSSEGKSRLIQIPSSALSNYVIFMSIRPVRQKIFVNKGPKSFDDVICQNDDISKLE